VYKANLVLVTNDPSQALFLTPVTLTVGEPPVFIIFLDRMLKN